MRTMMASAVLASALISCRPTPPSASAPVSAQPAAPTAAPVQQTSLYCVVRDGQLASVQVVRDTVRNEVLHEGRPIREVFPDTLPYAAQQRWYQIHDPFRFRGFLLSKAGLPRHIPAEELIRIGEHRGVPVFGERGSEESHDDVVFVPVRPGCEFQVYQNLHSVR